MAKRKSQCREGEVEVQCVHEEEEVFVELQRSQSSVQIKRDSKGNQVYEVKAYADTVFDALAVAKKAAEELDEFIGHKEG